MGGCVSAIAHCLPLRRWLPAALAVRWEQPKQPSLHVPSRLLLAALVLQEATPEACPSPTTACKDKLHRSFQLAKLQVGAAFPAGAAGIQDGCARLSGHLLGALHASSLQRRTQVPPLMSWLWLSPWMLR